MSKPTMHFSVFREELLSIAETVNADDINSLYRGLEQYILLCARTGMLISNSGCYMALGTNKVTISTWANGNRRQYNPQYKQFALLVKQICAAAREQYGIEGIVNPILTIFHQKQYDGFVDDPPPEIINNPLGDMPDADKLLKKYGGLFDEKAGTMG